MKYRKVLALLLGCAMFTRAGYSAEKEKPPKIHKDVQEKSAQE